MSRIAAVFPGQGSQTTGMLAGLAAAWPVVERTFAEASDVLGYDLWSLVRDNPDDALNRTVHTQPAMLAADIAVARVWREAGGAVPARLAGHSLGEYAALVEAGIVEFRDGIRLVAERARLMQEAVPAGEGGMAAILGLDDDRVAELCESIATARVVEPVNFNSPGQVVIAGHADAVARAVEAATEAGAKRTLDIPVSVPAHSSLMTDAADRLARYCADIPFRSPVLPVVHNVDAAEHADVDSIREALRRQLYNPVRWTDSVQSLRDSGVDTLLELGPGRVLTGLARRIDRSLTALPTDDPVSLDKALQHCGDHA